MPLSAEKSEENIPFKERENPFIANFTHDTIWWIMMNFSIFSAEC